MQVYRSKQLLLTGVRSYRDRMNFNVEEETQLQDFNPERKCFGSDTAKNKRSHTKKSQQRKNKTELALYSDTYYLFYSYMKLVNNLHYSLKQLCLPPNPETMSTTSLQSVRSSSWNRKIYKLPLYWEENKPLVAFFSIT